MGDDYEILIYAQGAVVGRIEDGFLTVTPGVMETKFEGTWHASGGSSVDSMKLLKNGILVGEEKAMNPITVTNGDSITFTYTLTMGNKPTVALPHYEIPKFKSVEEAEAWLDKADLTKSAVTPRQHAPNGPCKICGDLDDHFGAAHGDSMAVRTFLDRLWRKP
jgi:hypothetical protein